ncbi:MAG: SGNH/GDSL hydrolase family protein [Chloroflexi bacterium]|nr:SGNH/GDSL hydrolase family protein [Chloroflexota bacterium]
MNKRLYLLVFLTVLTACTAVISLPGETPASLSTLEPVAMSPIRYLALGDSYTIGESVAERERWSNQLVKLLENEGVKAEVTIIARTGWTTDELWQGIQAAKLEPPYDFVSLLIGVNNQYRGRDIEEYRQQFVFLLNKSIEYAGGDPKRVIVLSIPDWGVTPFASGRDREKIAQEIDAFNAVNREETEKAGAHYADVTPISRGAANDPSLIAPDGLHPSGKMYRMWAEKVLPAALEILSSQKGK